ncbi:hypothetical protein BDR26DRAFT_850461 [Obelidium mucronatum]|nr:hypothetical protein BDR26DRAFT_850461 [Obelidium mucronatum]
MLSITNHMQSPTTTKQSLEPAAQITSPQQTGPSISAPAVVSPRTHTNGLRIPVQINHPINHFLVASSSSSTSESRSSSQDSLMPNTVRHKSSNNRFSAPPPSNNHKHPLSFSHPNHYNQDASRTSSRSGSIIHRSSVSLNNEPTSMKKTFSMQSLAGGANGGIADSMSVVSSHYGSGSSRQRYAPAPYSFSSSYQPNYSSGIAGSGYISNGGNSGPSSDAGGSGTAGGSNGNVIGVGVGSSNLDAGVHQKNEVNEPQLILKDKVVLQPSDNQVTAHLASLMLANHTISPVMHRLEHATFRTGGGVNGTSSSSLASALAVSAGGGGLGVSHHAAGIISSTSGIASSSSGSMGNLSSPSTPFNSTTRKRGGTRRVHKITLPSNIAAGMPRASSSGGLFGLDSSTSGARTASSSGRSFGTSSSIASSKSSRSPSLSEHQTFNISYKSEGNNTLPLAPRRPNNPKQPNIHQQRIEESSEGTDDVAAIVADRLAAQSKRSSHLQSQPQQQHQHQQLLQPSQQKIGIIRRPSYNRSSNLNAVPNDHESSTDDDDRLTIHAKSPPTGAGFISRAGMGSFNAFNHTDLGGEGDVSPQQVTPPPRSTSSMSTRSTSSVSTVKKVVRVKSNASSMTITPGSMKGGIVSTDKIRILQC